MRNIMQIAYTENDVFNSSIKHEPKNRIFSLRHFHHLTKIGSSSTHLYENIQINYWLQFPRRFELQNISYFENFCIIVRYSETPYILSVNSEASSISEMNVEILRG